VKTNFLNGVMTETEQIKENDQWLEAFDAEERAMTPSSAWLLPFRKAGIAQYAKTGLPTLNDEDWRFTNIDPIRQMAFLPMTAAEKLDNRTLVNVAYPLKEQSTIRLVFLDGRYQQESSDLSALPAEAIALPLHEALKTHHAELERHLGNCSYQNDNPFAALNSAYFKDGLYLHLPRKCHVDTPIQIIHLSSGNAEGKGIFPRFVIHAETLSNCTILESHHGLNDACYLNAPTTEFVVDPEARIEHVKVQEESQKAFHMASIYVHMGRAARFRSHYLTMGGRINRNTIRTKLDGEGLACVLNGLNLADGHQLADNHMIVEHAQPHGESHEYFNGILDDHARAVFHGRILVQQIAQKTDAKQTSKNLLLSNDATVDTKPQLEIYADDVKCTHGATIGQLDEEAIYYLRSRGIPKPVAQRMLVHAFAGEITDRIEHQAIGAELNQIVWNRLENFSNFRLTERQ
jgi:Fe-S cluster assembly protein SufD